MSEIKLATFNVEWMVSLFGGLWKKWQSPYMPASFPRTSIGDINLEPISDVPALCERIAGVIRDMDAQIIGIQEGPPLTEQMEVFVTRFLDNQYAVYRSNAKWQSIYALVHRSVSDFVTAFAPKDNEVESLRLKNPYYPWGGIAIEEQKRHGFDRIPLVLSFRAISGKELRVVVVHTKSKYSKLKSPEQWASRDAEAILDALDARQKLSVEIACVRRYLDACLEPPSQDAAVVVMGDMNDGPYAELMEKEFLIHNIVDELAGTLLQPQRYFRHAMEADVLASATTTCFPDPLLGGELVAELIDHILVSPGIWQGRAPFALKAGSCQVETRIYDDHNEDHGQDGKRERGLRPSDHKPVSVVFTY